MRRGNFQERRQAVRSHSLEFGASTAFYEAMHGRSNIGNLPIDWINPSFHESSIHLRKAT